MAYRNPIRRCVECAYRVGYGFTTISRLTGVNKGLCRKWVVLGGMRRGHTKTSRPYTVQPRPPKLVKLQKLPKVKRSPEEKLEVARAFYGKHKDKIIAKQSHRYKTDPAFKAARLEARRRWGRENAEKAIAINKQWKVNNPEKFKAILKASRLKPKNKIVNNLRRRLRGFITKGERKQSSKELIGCSREFLVKWIEGKFAKGMSWDNYGEWHVDHKLPCAAFDLFDEKEQRKCFHYSNLQPLWAEDNIKKSATIGTIQPELLLVA